MDEKIFLNGNFISRADAKISVMDRGFLFGDGVYELIPIYNSKPFLIDRHLKRLTNSLSLINMEGDLSSIVDIKDVIDNLIKLNHDSNFHIYIHISRGIQDNRNHIYPPEIKPTVLIMGEKYHNFSTDEISKGFQACVQDDFRWTKSNIKSTSLLGNVILKNHASEKGMYETILIRNNKLTEGSASNVFIVNDEVIKTPKLSNELLPGVTRDLIIKLLKEKKYNVQECDLSSDDLKNADEVWCSSSTNAVVPITHIDDYTVNDGIVGTYSIRTHDLVKQFIEKF